MIAFLLFALTAHATQPGPAEIQAAFETAFQAGSTAPLTFSKDGVAYSASGQEEWEMLFAAREVLLRKWPWPIRKMTFKVSIGEPKSGPFTGELLFPFEAETEETRMKAPICLTNGLVLRGVLHVIEGEPEQHQLELKAFTQEVKHQQQCV